MLNVPQAGPMIYQQAHMAQCTHPRMWFDISMTTCTAVRDGTGMGAMAAAFPPPSSPSADVCWGGGSSCSRRNCWHGMAWHLHLAPPAGTRCASSAVRCAPISNDTHAMP